MSAILDSKIPDGPLEEKWHNHRFQIKLVNPANKRRFDVIVVGTGLAGASAAASLAELGYNVKVVTFHDSWPNFAKHFKLVIRGHVEPKPGIPPSPSHTLEIINLITAEKIPVILVEPYFDTKTPNSIAAATGATVVMFFPSVGGKPEIKDYFSLFDYDIDAFVNTMKNKK